MANKFQITNQKELRKAFWEFCDECGIDYTGMGEKCPYPKFSKLLAKGYIMCHRCKYCAEIISETEIMCNYN